MDSKRLARSLMLGSGSILCDHIDLYLERGNFPPEWNITVYNKKEIRDYGEAQIRFSAGSDAIPTAKQLYLKLNGQLLPDKISASLQKSFNVGSMWHEYLGLILKDMGFVDESGVEVYHLHKIERNGVVAYGSGKGDLVGVKIPGHGDWLVDIKTMNKASFESEPSKFLWDKYVAQVNLYGDWFGYTNQMILGVEKDSPHRFREWIIPHDQILVEQIYDKWIHVMECLENKIEPE